MSRVDNTPWKKTSVYMTPRDHNILGAIGLAEAVKVNDLIREGIALVIAKRKLGPKPAIKAKEVIVSKAVPPNPIGRRRLYDIVWSMSVQKAAKEFGISDSGLGNICRRYDIPRPPRGYFAKKAAGNAADRPPLPEGESDVITIVRASPAKRRKRPRKSKRVQK